MTERLLIIFIAVGVLAVVGIGLVCIGTYLERRYYKERLELMRRLNRS
jgi:hypothetical protein